MIKSRIKYLLAVLVLICSSPALAQSGGFAGVGLSLGFGPRGMAISNAMAASTFEGFIPIIILHWQHINQLAIKLICLFPP